MCPMSTIVQTVKKHDVPMPADEVKACKGSLCVLFVVLCDTAWLENVSEVAY